MAEGAAVIGDVAVGEKAGFDLDAGGFEERAGEGEVGAKGGDVSINQVDQFGQVGTRAASGTDRGNEQQMGDGIGDGARAAAEGDGDEAFATFFAALTVLDCAGEDEQSWQLRAAEVIGQGVHIKVVSHAGYGERGQIGQGGTKWGHGVSFREIEIGLSLED